MNRFFVKPSAIHDGQVKFDADQSHKIKHVLRLDVNDSITVFDNSLWEYDVTLIEISSHMTIGIVKEKSRKEIYPKTKISVYLSPLKRENFEWALQKCTEIGVYEFVPTIFSRTILNIDYSSQRYIRWQRIIIEASEQSHRIVLPELHEPLKYQEAIRRARFHGLNLIPWELEGETRIQDVLSRIETIETPYHFGLFIGPEGGLTNDEIIQAKLNGLTAVTLGENILRSETAAIVASTVLIHFS